jgi:hypothetical protein
MGYRIRGEDRNGADVARAGYGRLCNVVCAVRLAVFYPRDHRGGCGICVMREGGCVLVLLRTTLCHANL